VEDGSAASKTIPLRSFEVPDLYQLLIQRPGQFIMRVASAVDQSMAPR